MNEDDDKTRIIGRRALPQQDIGSDSDDEKTRIIRQSSSVSDDLGTSAPTRIFSADEKQVEADQKTVLFKPNSSSGKDSGMASGNSVSEPVVGWMVIVEGAGKGNSHNLSYGVNQIGRDEKQRISLNYGDSGISRENHVSVVYDQRNRKFFIQQGNGSGLAYLHGEPILQPLKLEGYERIVIGSTTLAFIPFCNSEFDWEDA